MMAIAQHCSLIAIKGMEDSQKLIWCNAGKQAFFLLYSACRCAKAFYMALHSSAWSPSWSSPLALLGVGADLAFLYALLVLNASFASWAT